MDMYINVCTIRRFCCLLDGGNRQIPKFRLWRISFDLTILI